jgi:hypothetical protein
MKEEFTLSKIKLEDAPILHALAIDNGGNINMNAKNLNHWYLKNPEKSSSLWKIEMNNVIEGYATTNNFIYTCDNKDYLVALPQNVLTSTNVRGKGLFGKLYYKTETDNIENNGVDFFLTSTGAMSTPIFLKKFDYLRGVCPNVLVKILSLPALFSKKKYKIIPDINSIPSLSHCNLNNGRKKNIEYFKWRYSQCHKNKLSIIAISNDKETIGYAFLISKTKFGIRTLILADIICEKEENYSAIVDACSVFAAKNFYVIMVMFELSFNCRRKGINLKVKNRFNFLVKGKTKEETSRLSTKDFNFFFGDLDYFW